MKNVYKVWDKVIGVTTLYIDANIKVNNIKRFLYKIYKNQLKTCLYTFQ